MFTTPDVKFFCGYYNGDSETLNGANKFGSIETGAYIFEEAALPVIGSIRNDFVDNEFCSDYVVTKIIDGILPLEIERSSYFTESLACYYEYKVVELTATDIPSEFDLDDFSEEVVTYVPLAIWNLPKDLEIEFYLWNICNDLYKIGADTSPELINKSKKIHCETKEFCNYIIPKYGKEIRSYEDCNFYLLENEIRNFINLKFNEDLTAEEFMKRFEYYPAVGFECVFSSIKDEIDHIVTDCIKWEESLGKPILEIFETFNSFEKNEFCKNKSKGMSL